MMIDPLKMLMIWLKTGAKYQKCATVKIYTAFPFGTGWSNLVRRAERNLKRQVVESPRQHDTRPHSIDGLLDHTIGHIQYAFRKFQTPKRLVH